MVGFLISGEGEVWMNTDAKELSFNELENEAGSPFDGPAVDVLLEDDDKDHDEEKFDDKDPEEFEDDDFEEEDVDMEDIEDFEDDEVLDEDVDHDEDFEEDEF